MSTATAERQAYPHPHVNEALLVRLREDIIEPSLPILEAHHHLWDRASGVYLLDELRADLMSKFEPARFFGQPVRLQLVVREQHLRIEGADNAVDGVLQQDAALALSI